MNENTPTIQNTLENALISSIEGIKKTGTELVDALYQQAPEVINQLLLWHGVESFVMFLTSLLLLCMPFIYYKLAVAAYVKFNVQKMSDEFPYWMITIVSGIVSTIGSTTMAIDLMNLKWLKIWLAPKVYLLEYLTTLVK